MEEQDTVKLLKECDAGVKMGVKAIDDVMEHVKSKTLNQILIDSKIEHEKMQKDLNNILDNFNYDGKDPNPIAESMSWMKTNIKLGMDETDNKVADIITDGCNMGVKSLNRYLNKYGNADKRAKDITKRLIDLEKSLQFKMEQYL
ncbi:MAG: hypothetical protein IJZ94_03200 [Clostridia bacterium]|nr:hypothetical protein [Clostridia bacterium]